MGWIPTAASATLSVKSDHSDPVELANKFNLEGGNTRELFFFFTLFTLFKLQIGLKRSINPCVCVGHTAYLASSLTKCAPYCACFFESRNFKDHVEAGLFCSKRAGLGNSSGDKDTLIFWFLCCMTAKRAVGVSW